jgi:hypothetical protein
MARQNYGYEKRQKELAKQKKKEEKRRRKLEKTKAPSDENPDQSLNPVAPA